MEEWADGRVVEATRALSLDQSGSYQTSALLSALELIESLLTETAAHLGYLFPTLGQRRTLDWLYQIIHQSHD